MVSPSPAQLEAVLERLLRIRLQRERKGAGGQRREAGGKRVVEGKSQLRQLQFVPDVQAYWDGLPLMSGECWETGNGDAAQLEPAHQPAGGRQDQQDTRHPVQLGDV